MLKIQNVQQIDVDDWDEIVKETYGKPYSFQQQDGCKDRGIAYITVPDDEEDFDTDSVPEIVNRSQMGVSFKAWLARDPSIRIRKEDQWSTNLWWERNFYPHVSMVANDLHAKGLLPAGEYQIVIDW